MAGYYAEKWRVLDFSGFQGEIRAERGALSVESDGADAEVKVPVADVGVVLIGVNTRFSAGVIHRLVENDVAVIFCDWKGCPYGGAYGWSDHSRVGARHLAQAQLSLPRKKAAWTQLVKAKIHGQANVLACLSETGAGFLNQIAKAVKSGDISNSEGQAARYYWSKLWGETGFRRNPGIRDQENPQNSLLDYGYTVLRGHAMRAVCAAGLSPAIGVFHHGRSNYFALADDLIEPFRPAIDFCVAKLGTDTSRDSRAVKSALVEAAGGAFNGVGDSIPTEMTALAQRLGMYVEGEKQKLKVNIWDSVGLEARRLW
ncbi:type II CRISPR-associated endonuclease Cas1 [Arcanobacterium hippocoleae]